MKYTKKKMRGGSGRGGSGRGGSGRGASGRGASGRRTMTVSSPLRSMSVAKLGKYKNSIYEETVDFNGNKYYIVILYNEETFDIIINDKKNRLINIDTKVILFYGNNNKNYIVIDVKNKQQYRKPVKDRISIQKNILQDVSLKEIEKYFYIDLCDVPYEVIDYEFISKINKEVLPDYNEKLRKCDLSLVFNRYKNKLRDTEMEEKLGEIKLCLMYEGVCISNISYDIDQEITINSSTEDKYEGNRYNKLLRCISAIIFRKFNEEKKEERKLYSIATNKISGWLLLQLYEVDTDFPIPKLLEKIKEYSGSLLSKSEKDGKDYHKTEGFEILYKVQPSDPQMYTTQMYTINKLNIDFDTFYESYKKNCVKNKIGIKSINIIKNGITNLFNNIHIYIPLNDINLEKANYIFNELIAEGSKKKLSCPEDKCNNIYDELQKCLSNIPVNPDDPKCKTLKTLLKGKTNKNIHCNLEIDPTLEKPTPIKILKSFETPDNEINIIDYLNTYYPDLLTEDGSKKNNASSRASARASTSTRASPSPRASSPRARASASTRARARARASPRASSPRASARASPRASARASARASPRASSPRASASTSTRARARTSPRASSPRASARASTRASARASTRSKSISASSSAYETEA